VAAFRDRGVSAAPDPPAGHSPVINATPPHARTVELTTVTVLAVLYTAYFARAFLVPVAIATLLALLLSPVIRWMARRHLPPPASAAIVVLALIGGGVVGLYHVATPARRWVAGAPEAIAHAGRRIESIVRPVTKVASAADQVAQAAAPGTQSRAQQVVVAQPALSQRLFGTTEVIVVACTEIVLLLYFMLAAGDLFLQKILKMLPRTRDRANVLHLAETVEASVSSYLLANATINAAEGTVVAIVFSLMGVATPGLWGALAALLAFIPYLGALTMTAMLAIAGFSTYPDTMHALLLPGVYFLIDFLQSNVVTPLVMSRRLTLNPVAVFLALAFWWWVWGIAGAFLAVPMLAVFKIVCDHIERLAPIGEFLSGREPGERRWLVRWNVQRPSGRGLPNPDASPPA
jgi:predicted PurR-regulated permease PerM